MEEREGLSRGALIAIIAGASAGVLAIIVALVVVAVTFLRVPEPVTAEPGQDVFDALRLSDSDVAYLGLEAGNFGRTPSQLSTVVSQLTAAWVAAKGAPEECSFAGTFPGAAVLPIWGTETDTDPMWREKTVSAPQTLLLDGAPFITVSARTFADDSDAVSFLLDHNDAIPGCPSLTVTDFQADSVTTLTPLLMNSIGISNTGWVAETDDWIETGAPPETAVDLQTWVINLQRSNVVMRLTMVVPAEIEGDAGPFFTDLAGTVATKMNAVIAD